MGCTMDQPDSEAIQLPCGKVEYTESFKYLGVEFIQVAIKVFRSTALHMKLRVKLLQTLTVPTVLHGCECCTLSRTVCDKLNVFQSRCLGTILGVRWQDHVSYDTVRSRCEVTMSLAQLVRLQRLGWTGHVLRHNDLIVHDVLFSRADYIELWWQTWLVTSVSSATSPVRTAHCRLTEMNSTAQAHRSSDKLVTLAVSSAPTAPSRTSPPAGTRTTSAGAPSPVGRSRAELN